MNPAVSVTKRPLLEGWFRPGGNLLVSQWTLWTAFSLLAALINAISGVADTARSGGSTPIWEHYAAELTSWFGFAVVAPMLFSLDNALAARKVPLPQRVSIYVAFSVIFSGLHIALMVGARPPVFALFGDRYEIGSWLGRFTYEYPKDITTYLIALGVSALLRRSMPADAPANAPASAPAPGPSFLARGATGETLIRVAEIDWVEAQGNYVALHVAGSAYLVRRTLQEVDTALSGCGFVRTHRSAMVRSSLIRSLGVGEDGSLFVSLDSGERAPLSRGRKQIVRAAISS
ncbi:MAG TPA: LytTR family DNA-binding domain-containing protein [Hyphomonadaceae bacterium]|jgi:hypothetical protein|nr:LytTR family DNA-binding domain-containing protein [Hyphomonadaceae bacterium]